MKNVGAKAFAQFLGAGMGEEAALEQMERYLKMAADAAARYDITLEDADARLRSFLRGNTEAGDMIGLFTSESQRSAYALEKYGEDWNKLSESQKQWLMMDVAKDIYDISKVTGTAAEEADGWANVISNLSDAWNKSKGLMGGGIQDAMTPMLQELTAFLSKEETKTKLTEFGNTLGDISGYAFDGVTGFLQDLQTGEYDGNIASIKGFADAFTDTKISANLGAFVGHLKTASGLTFTGVKEFFADSIPEGDNAVWTNVAALAEDFTGLLAAIPPETLSAVETGLLGMFAAMKPGWAGLLTLGLVAANWKEIKSATEGALEASNAYFTEGKLPTLNEEQKKQLNESYETLNKLSTLTFGFELPDWSLVTAWAASGETPLRDALAGLTEQYGGYLYDFSKGVIDNFVGKIKASFEENGLFGMLTSPTSGLFHVNVGDLSTPFQDGSWTDFGLLGDWLGINGEDSSQSAFFADFNEQTGMKPLYLSSDEIQKLKEAQQSSKETETSSSGAFENIRKMFTEKLDPAAEESINKVRDAFEKISGYLTAANEEAEDFSGVEIPASLLQKLQQLQSSASGLAGALSSAVYYLNRVGSGGGGGLFNTKAMHVGPGYATGLDYVPYDNFPAMLHKGESVLTRSDAEEWRKGGSTPTLEHAVSQLSGVVQRIESKMDKMAVIMDGESVGRMVTGYVSENIASDMQNYRY